MLLICVPKVFNKVQVHSVPRKIHESMDFSHTKVQQNKFFVDSDGFNQDFYTHSPNNPRWTMRPPAMRHFRVNYKLKPNIYIWRTPGNRCSP